MTTRRDFQKLSEARLQDAMILQQHNRSSSAYYLAGYCIELALKACISRQFQADEIPDKSFVVTIHTHRPDTLLSASGLSNVFKEDCKNDPLLAAHWGVVCNWSESSRYSTWDPITSHSLLVAISDAEHGVLQWLKKHW